MAPEVYNEVLQNSKHNTDITTSSLMQRSLDMYIAKGNWKNNINELNFEYSKRYNLIKTILDDDFKNIVSYVDPRGGLNFYLTLINKKVDTKLLFKRLKKKKVYITPGNVFFTSSDEGQDSFKISFYQVNKEKIKIGMDLLREVILDMQEL